ncbi:necrosis inducing protein [Colletotrichum graminicola]|uniref:Necrosis inducing protein n=1 Tax=Colletotrichum graminicola (strain M1.001 / M2 / FGSC 10212) TaxID=645133 RepID=E3QHP1_COLGM|nr:necrosis inducing protein [Colletotrichum graminicola M1.001]EFQ30379.1 necrosis inducing protein [Colletotrichum graminicola M1.001]WDK18631.1 necrosis inducing protein [Colletotrichum graminicola]
MFCRSFLTLFSLGLVASAAGRTLSQRDDDAFEGKVKDHDAIAPFAQQAADGLPGQLQLQFKPALNDVRGCLPYPAVDAEGFHSGGLKPTGTEDGDCRGSSTGQVYSRVGYSNGRMAVLYAWYLPKMMTMSVDNPSSRHWYLSSVVWLHTEECNATAADFTVAGVSYSLGEDAYSKRFDQPTLFAADDVSSTHPVVGYRAQTSVFPSYKNVTDGLDMPLVSWTKLPQPAVDQFNGFVYELARCPFQDANFQASLDAAFSPDFYANLTAEPDAATCAANPTDESSRAVKAARALGDTEPIVDGPNIDIHNPPADPVFTSTPPRSTTSSRPTSTRRPTATPTRRPTTPTQKPAREGSGPKRPGKPRKGRKRFLRDVGDDE